MGAAGNFAAPLVMCPWEMQQKPRWDASRAIQPNSTSAIIPKRRGFLIRDSYAIGRSLETTVLRPEVSTPLCGQIYQRAVAKSSTVPVGASSGTTHLVVHMPGRSGMSLSLRGLMRHATK